MTQEKFKKLFDNHFDSVRNYIFYRSGDKDLATDIAQDTFMRIWEKKINFNADNPSALLYKIASNLFVSNYRRKKLALNFQLNIKSEESSNSPEDELRFKELNNKYNKALQQMPEKQRTVFLMSRLENLKYHEIAEAIGLSVKAIEKRMNLALTFLKKELID
ncbi:RNA polymerase sigma factor [Bacteroidota bacterium]